MVLEKVTGELKGIAAVERPPLMEGRMISMIVMRAPGWEPAKKEAPTPRVRKHDAQEADEDAETDETPTVSVSEEAAETVAPAQVAEAASEPPTTESANAAPTA